MGIALTDDHRELGEVARSFLTAQKARWAARELLDAAEEARPPFWSELAELGWLGLHVDEQYGGSGYGLPELVVVIDELGRAVAPGPFVPTAVVSAVISAVGTDEQKARLLPGLIDGSVTAAVGFGGDVSLSDGKASGDGGVVLGAGLADLLLLVAGDDVVLVDRNADGVSVDVPGNLDRTRRSGRVSLTDVAVGDNILTEARSAAVAYARTLFAAEAAGGASDCVDTAVEYAKVREQFGRTIATFQAVKHHCANMLVAAESTVAAVWDAARAADESAEEGQSQFELIAAAAATLAFGAYVRNAELNIQVHGGIGFTWEHDAHLHLRRALTVQALLGGDGPSTDVFDLTALGREPVQQPRPARRRRRPARADPLRRRRTRQARGERLRSTN